MSYFDLKGSTSAGGGWNYSKPDQPDYRESVTGTVVKLSAPQALDFQTRQPKFWPDGNPVLNICVHICDNRDGKEVLWVFSKKSAAADACIKAVDPEGKMANVSVADLAGKMVTVATKAGVYASGHPRPWKVVVEGEGAVPFEGIEEPDIEAMKKAFNPQNVPQGTPPNIAQAAKQIIYGQPQMPMQPQGMPMQQMPMQQMPQQAVYQAPQGQPQYQAATVYDAEIPF